MTTIACLLSEPELAARRAAIAQALAEADVQATEELPDGWIVRFAPVPDLLTRLARFVDLERACCPFLAFTLEAPANGGPLALRVTGPPGTKEMVRDGLRAGTGI